MFLSTLKYSKEFGLHGVQTFAKVAVVFVPLNLVFVLISLFFYDTSHKVAYSLSVLLALAIGVGMVCWAGMRAYRYMMNKGINTLYDNSIELIYGFCEEVVAQAAKISKEYLKIDETKYSKALEWDTLISQVYAQKIPEPANGA